MTVLGFPGRFTGTPEEAYRNLISHDWVFLNGQDVRCLVCDCRRGGAVSTWPCGDEPPRRTYDPQTIYHEEK